MDRNRLYEIRKQLEQDLPEDRYQHTLGVEFTAACLAMRYGADVYKAELAGLLHDCAKMYSGQELIRLCAEAGVELTEGEKAAPKVLHAVYGPVLAKQRYGVDDVEILSAIRWHTTGRENMALLDKIIYTADFIEPCREMITILPEIRSLAFKDLTYAVFRIAEETIPYVKMRGLPIDSHTQGCYNWLKENGFHDR